MIGPSALLLWTPLPSLAHAASGGWVLGQTSRGNSQSGPVSLQQSFDILVGLGWLVAAVILLVVVAFALRKWLLRDDATGAGVQFTMADLRQMRDEGLMSPEEFDRAKMFLVSRSKALLEKQDEPALGVEKPENTSEKEADGPDQSTDEPDGGKADGEPGGPTDPDKKPPA